MAESVGKALVTGNTGGTGDPDQSPSYAINAVGRRCHVERIDTNSKRSKPQLICYIRRQPRQRDHLQPTLWRHALMMDDSLDDRRTADWRDEQQECVENDEPQDDSLLLLCHPWPAAQWLARRSPSSSLNVHRPLAPPVLRRLYSRSSRVRAGESGLARSEGGPSDRRCRDAREQQRAACRSDPTKLSVASTLSIERSDLAIQSSFH